MNVSFNRLPMLSPHHINSAFHKLITFDWWANQRSTLYRCIDGALARYKKESFGNLSLIDHYQRIPFGWGIWMTICQINMTNGLWYDHAFPNNANHAFPNNAHRHVRNAGTFYWKYVGMGLYNACLSIRFSHAFIKNNIKGDFQVPDDF